MVTQRPCKGFGAEIRFLREEKRMTEEEFAWLLNTDTKAINSFGEGGIISFL